MTIMRISCIPPYLLRNSLMPLAMICALLAFPFATSAVGLDDGLVAYYPFDGNAQDASGNNHHGTVTGATIKEGVLYLSESQVANSFATFGNNIDQFKTNDFSVAFWFRTQEKSRLFDLAGDRTAGSHGNFLAIRMTGKHESVPEGTVMVELDQDNQGSNYISIQSTTNRLNDGNWHQIAVVREGKSLTLYIDSKLEKTASANGITNISNNNAFKLGRSYADFPNAVVQYDNLCFYNRALSVDKIKILSQEQITTTTKPEQPTEPNPSFSCKPKKNCGDMDSCEEAYYHLEQCGRKGLDRDKDGIPCESICKQ